MHVETRDAYLELLKQCLTRAMFIGEERSAGRRRRATGLVMRMLASRGYVVVPRMPSVDALAVRRVPRLPGSRLLVWRLARRGFAVVPDTTLVTRLLAARGFVMVPRMPSVDAVAVRRVPRLPGSRLLIRQLASSDFTVVPDTGARASLRDGGTRHPPRGVSTRVARIEREFGLDWPEHAETMVGLRRLDNVQECIEDVLRRGVPGDLIETGVWRGGTTILMRAVLAANDDDERRVWVADSFEGLPKPDPDSFPADAGLDYTVFPKLSVGVQQVQANFARYGLLDDRVEFLPGWFKDTLPTAPIDRIAVMRLDGDLYESTMDALDALYPKLSEGGYCIIDDYGAIEACRRAVHDYRRAHGIHDEIQPVDWTGAYWRRSAS